MSHCVNGFGRLRTKASNAGTRGGFYSEGPAAAFDHSLPHLKVLLGFMGITEVESVIAEGLATGGDAANRAITTATKALHGLAATAAVA